MKTKKKYKLMKLIMHENVLNTYAKYNISNSPTLKPCLPSSKTLNNKNYEKRIKNLTNNTPSSSNRFKY